MISCILTAYIHNIYKPSLDYFYYYMCVHTLILPIYYSWDNTLLLMLKKNKEKNFLNISNIMRLGCNTSSSYADWFVGWLQQPSQ